MCSAVSSTLLFLLHIYKDLHGGEEEALSGGEGVGVAVAAVDDRPRTSPNVCTAPFSLQAVHNALPTKARRHLSKL